MVGLLKAAAIFLASCKAPKNSAGSTETSSTPPLPRVSLNVCVSPGCMADGAPITLDKLRALAPGHVDVQGGPCRSFCGSGPVVVEDTTTTTRTAVVANGNKNNKMQTKPHKKINSEERILKLLYPNGDVPAPTIDLVEGYNLGMDGDKAFEKKDYMRAVTLYEKAVSLAFRAAVDLQTQRYQYNNNDGESSKPKGQQQSKNLEWLIRVRRNEAVSKLELGDYDGALSAIQASCDMSSSAGESILVLARVYEKKGDIAGELDALEHLFAIPVDEGKLGRKEQNDRRLAQMRLQKLRFMKARS